MTTASQPQTISAQLEAFAAELMADAREQGLTMETLTDGSVVTQGTTEPLRLARVARLVELAAQIMKEVGR
jgi:hypothetical protein